MVSTVGPGNVRARDLDRVHTVAQLDAAYADGQLGAAEYHDRVAQARAGKTLGELAECTADLQGPAATGPPSAPRSPESGRSGRFFAFLAAAALVVAGCAYTLVSRDTDPVAAEPPPAAAAPKPAGEAAEEPEPLVFAPPELLTGAGIAQFVAEYRDRFGDTVADEMWLYSDHGNVERAVPGQPNRLVAYDYRGGFQQSADPTTRRVDTPTVDLGTLDPGAIDRALLDAAAITQVPGGAVSHLSFRINSSPPFTDTAAVSVYVANDFDENGWFLLGPAGEILKVWPFEA